jgi:hypothetical protein
LFSLFAILSIYPVIGVRGEVQSVHVQEVEQSTHLFSFEVHALLCDVLDLVSVFSKLNEQVDIAALAILQKNSTVEAKLNGFTDVRPEGTPRGAVD